MIRGGVYPAAVTPFDEKGRVDFGSVAKLLAWFEASDCTGVVLAGTNGEGPSLSATEKRELIEKGMSLRGKLDLILGIATPSLEEAAWLCRRAADCGAVAALVMPPFYFREATEQAVEAWFLQLMDRSPSPVIVYNFPKRAGITLSADLIERLGAHDNMAGVKDSSGDRENLAGYRAALMRSDQVLFVGDETLLLEALLAGWSGSISGAANSIPLPLSTLVADFLNGKRDSAEAKFRIVEPVIEAIRRHPQPASHKMLLHLWGVLARPDVRLPLTNRSREQVAELAELIRSKTGLPG